MKKISLILIVFIATAHIQAQTCGNFQKIYSTSYYDSMGLYRPMVFQDRFGNEYMQSDLVLENMQVYNSSSGNQPRFAYPYETSWTCQAGIFTLYFAKDHTGYGFSNSNYRLLVCQVFKDMSRLLFDVNPSNPGRVNIWIASDSMFKVVNKSYPTGVNALASGLMTFPNGINNAFIDNEVGKTIKTGVNSYIANPQTNGNNLIHGFLAVDFKNSPWSINYDSATISSNQLDMYTVLLHEVFHVLGMSSALNPNGSTKLNATKVYTLYDKFLIYGSDSSQRILQTQQNNTIIFNNVVSNISTGCKTNNSIKLFGVHLKGQEVYSPTSYSSGSSFSHLCCENGSSCTPYANTVNDYVTAYCGDLGSLYIKRRPNLFEVKLLCELGYSLKNIGGVYAYGDNPANTQVYKTYNGCNTPINYCQVTGVDDYRPNVRIGDSVVLLYDTILKNDINASGIKNIHLADTNDGVLKIYAQRIVFYPSYRIRNAVARIKYYPVCGVDSIKGLVTYIHIGIDVPSTTLCQQDHDCNLVCKGDFEDANPVHSAMAFNPGYFWYLGRSIPNSNDLYKQCIVGPDTLVYWDAGVPICGASGLEPRVKLDKKGGQYCGGILVNSGPVTKSSEAITFRMKEALQVGKSYRLEFLARKTNTQSFHTSFKVMFWGDSLAQFYGSSLANPTGVNALRLDRQNLVVQTYDTVWKTYVDTITPTRTIQSILVMNDSFLSRPPALAMGTKLLIDNVRITELNTTALSMQSETEIKKPCIDENNTYIIRYTVCAETQNMSSDITLRLKLPPQVKLKPGGSFQANLTTTIAKDSLKQGMCRTRYLHYTLDKQTTVAGQPLVLECEMLNNNVCYSTNDQSVVTIVPDNPPIQITKTVNTSFAKIGDTLTYTVHVCNTSADSITKVNLVDYLPTNLLLIDKGGFTQYGQTLRDSFRLYAAFASARPYCVERSFRAKVTNSCTINNCAYASVEGMTCPSISDCTPVYINTSNADSIYLATREVIDTLYHIKNYANPNTKTLIFNGIQNRVFRAGIVVDSGYTLKIINNSAIELGDTAMLEVRNRGVLYIDHSTIGAIRNLDTCMTPHTWQGIRVFPYKSTHLNPTNMFFPWSYTPLEISHSTISHAQIAVKSGFSYNSGDALGSNGQPVIIERSSHNVSIKNSNFINNAEAVSFATEFFNGGYLHFEGNTVAQTHSPYIQSYRSMLNLYYYQTALRPPVATSNHPVWDWQLRIHHNTLHTIQNYEYGLQGIQLQLGRTGNDCDCVVSDDLQFKHNKISNFMTGIKMTGSRFYTFVYDTIVQCQMGMDIGRFEAVRVDSSQFDYNVVGLSLNTVGAKNYPYEWRGKDRMTTISNSVFNDINGNTSDFHMIAAKAVYLNNVKDANIYNNVFVRGTVNAGDNITSYTGVHLNKAENVKVYENGFTNPSGTVNTVSSVAFYAENNATNVNAFSKNTVSNYWHVGAWVWGENRNLRMRCNQFGTPAHAAILVQGNLRDQGLPDGILETEGCDDEKYPAANVFLWLPSHSSACGISPESAIKVDTAKSNFRFYYNTQSLEGPTNFSPQTPDPLCRSNTYGDVEWKYNACVAGTPGYKIEPITCDVNNIFSITKPPHEDVPCEEMVTFIGDFQGRVIDFRGQLTTLVAHYYDFVHLADQQRIYHGLMKESKDIQVSIRRKCPDSLPTLQDYLDESPFWEDKVERVEDVLRRKDFSGFATAKAKLDSFPIESILYQGQQTLTKLIEDKEDLKFIYTQEKDLLQAETNENTSFQISEGNLAQLFAIQAKQSYAGAVAERVLAKLLDTSFIHPLPSLPVNDTVADINWEQYYNDYPVMIFPNPTEGFIRFEFDVPTPIETASIQIVKVSNPSTYVLVDDFTENFFSRVYDLSDKAEGIYIMAIKVNGTIVTAKQFKIQR